MNDLHEAKKYLLKSLRVDPENKAILKELEKLDKDIVMAKQNDERSIKLIIQKNQGNKAVITEQGSVPKIREINMYTHDKCN